MHGWSSPVVERRFVETVEWATTLCPESGGWQPPVTCAGVSQHQCNIPGQGGIEELETEDARKQNHDKGRQGSSHTRHDESSDRRSPVSLGLPFELLNCQRQGWGCLIGSKIGNPGLLRCGLRASASGKARDSRRFSLFSLFLGRQGCEL
jgi:hypothetical protein